MYSTKTVLVFLVIGIVCVQSRPEPSKNGKESANLPSPTEENVVRTGKERNLYLHGGEIPVHLVYDAEDHETEAVVKEISSDSLLKKTLGDKTRESRSKKFDALLDSKNNEKSKKISILDNVKSGNVEKEISNGDDPISINSPSVVYVEDLNEKTGFMPRSLAEESLDNKKIKRKIQHYQTVYQPNLVLLNPMLGSPSPFMSLSQNHAESDGEKRQTVYSTASLTSGLPYQAQFPVFQGYLPVSSNSPYRNIMWTAVTNIVEYSEEGEDCKKEHVKSRRKRDASSRNGRENSGPQIMRLKVRRGGVAIAGPGGIATAGAGGTAIVGPGGTAYASPSGTAIVGPGGKVIQLPAFEGGTPVVRARNSKTPNMDFKVVASGPVVYVGPKTTTVERL